MVFKLATAYTKEQSDLLKKEFIEKYEINDCVINITCHEIGIPKQTYFYWREHDTEFRSTVEEVYERYKDKWQVGLHSRARKDGGSLMIYVSKKLLKDRGYDDEPITQTILEPYKPNETDHDLLARIEASAIEKYKAKNESI